MSMGFDKLINDLNRHKSLWKCLNKKQSIDLILRNQLSFTSIRIEPKTFFQRVVKWLWDVLFGENPKQMLQTFGTVDKFGHEFSLSSHEQEFEIL